MASFFLTPKIINLETSAGASRLSKNNYKKSIIQIIFLCILYNFVDISANTLGIIKGFYPENYPVGFIGNQLDNLPYL